MKLRRSRVVSKVAKPALSRYTWIMKKLLTWLFGTRKAETKAAVEPTSYAGYSAERLLTNRYDGPEGW